MSRHTALVDLAIIMGLSPLHTRALPTVVEVSARKAGMAEATLIAECFANAPLRAYLASVCATVMNNEH